MWQEITRIFASPILVGIILYLFQKAAEKREAEREKETEERDELREEAEKVNREVNTATMELSYATAVAVERGKTNGELKKAKAAYNNAVKHQDELGRKLLQRQQNKK